jgi:dolichyl-phosphate beta-glucosyltransferase
VLLQTWLLRWFLSPIASSFADPLPTTYTHTLRLPSETDGAAAATAQRTNAAKEADGEQAFPFPQALLFDDATWRSAGNHVSLSAVVPSYNEEERLQLMVDDALAYLLPRAQRDPNFTFELLFVDDGSRDGTAALVQRLVVQHGPERMRLLKLQANQGKGGAVQQGMLHARGELLLMVDADGATRFADVERLEKQLASVVSQPGSNGHGVAVGSRKHLQSDAVATRKWYRNVLMYGFHFLVSTLTGIAHVQDTQCGFKLFTRPTAQYLFVNQHLRRWCFDVELLFLTVQSALASRNNSQQQQSIGVVEVPVNWQEIPGSKIDLLQSSFLMGRDLLIIRAAYALGVWKFATHKQIVANMLHRKHADVNAQVQKIVATSAAAPKKKASSKKK